MKRLKGLILSSTVLALGLGLLGEASANDLDKRWGWGRGGISRPTPGRAQEIRLSEPVKQYLTGKSTLLVRQLLKMGPQYKGMKLKEVILVASTRAGHGKAALMIDGEQQGMAQTVGVYEQAYTFKPQSGWGRHGTQDIIGDEVQTIQIDLQGQFYVEKVMAVLEKETVHAQVKTVQKHIGSVFRGQNMIAVRQELGLGPQFRGDKLLSVTIKADSAAGFGQASLIVNGMQVGMSKTLGRFGTTATFMLPMHANELGDDIFSVKIALQGNIYVESLSAQILETTSRGFPGRGGRH